MKILAFSPADPESLSGNAVTLRRIRLALQARGHGFRIVHAREDDTVDALRRQIQAEAPDVVHYYHAWKTGRFLVPLGHPASVLTLSGTDLNQDYEDPVRREAIDHALRQARVVLTYNASLARRVPRTRLIPKGLFLGQAPFDLRAALGLAKDAVVFLLAGGLRRVKNPLFALDALEPLQKAHPALRVVLAGPLMDASLGREVAWRMDERPWIQQIIIPQENMQAAFQACDVVLNTSHSEGLSNALMEAMSAGVALLISDNTGNRDLLETPGCGMLYRDLADFQDKALRLIQNPALRHELGTAAQADAARRFSTERETDALIAAYTEALRPV